MLFLVDRQYFTNCIRLFSVMDIFSSLICTCFRQDDTHLELCTQCAFVTVKRVSVLPYVGDIMIYILLIENHDH